MYIHIFRFRISGGRLKKPMIVQGKRVDQNGGKTELKAPGVYIKTDVRRGHNVTLVRLCVVVCRNVFRCVSMVQCAAVCSVLQCAVCCSALQCVVVCYSLLQCVAQSAALCCAMWRWSAASFLFGCTLDFKLRIATYCNTLHYAATRCNTVTHTHTQVRGLEFLGVDPEAFAAEMKEEFAAAASIEISLDKDGHKSYEVSINIYIKIYMCMYIYVYIYIHVYI